jgi:hypothetical protein
VNVESEVNITVVPFAIRFRDKCLFKVSLGICEEQLENMKTDLNITTEGYRVFYTSQVLIW